LGKLKKFKLKLITVICLLYKNENSGAVGWVGIASLSLKVRMGTEDIEKNILSIKKYLIITHN
jgi:hypothetical protein